MSIKDAIIISSEDQVGSGALIGKLVYDATSIYHPIMVFGGVRQLHESELLELVEKSATVEDPRCVVIAVLSAFAESPFEDETPSTGDPLPSPDVAFLLGYLQGRLPKSHIFVIRDSVTSDFWVDPQVSAISPDDPNWRVALARALEEVGVEVDIDKATNPDE